MKDYVRRHREVKNTLKVLGSALPSPMHAFGELHRGALAEGELSTRTKELVALAIAVAVRCDDCIAFHVAAAVTAGASREAIAEAIGVAILMGGGPAVMYGCAAMEALEQFTKPTSG